MSLRPTATATLVAAYACLMEDPNPRVRADTWPDTELFVITDAGHQGSHMMRERRLDALGKFARQ